jgi:hypothetical protein
MLDALMPEAAARGRHLLSLLFTHWTVLGLVLTVVTWFAARRTRDERGRETVLVVASAAALVVLGSLPVTAALMAFALLFWRRSSSRRGPSGRSRRSDFSPPSSSRLSSTSMRSAASARACASSRRSRPTSSGSAAGRISSIAGGTGSALAARRFLLAVVFFPTVVNGPIETPHAFARNWEEPALVPALLRVARGVGKLVLVAFLFAPGWTGGLAFAGLESTPRLWLWGIRLYVWFYLGFSGWSDVAIGLARASGRVVPENFDRPWLARDPAEFWRRWHVSLGVWLRDYVYVPLGGRRRRALNVLLTFLVSAAWHIWGSVKLLGLGFFGPHAWDGFLLWGLLNALGVLASRPVASWHAGGGGAWRLRARRRSSSRPGAGSRSSSRLA